jgi:hypothetical protein
MEAAVRCRQREQVAALRNGRVSWPSLLWLVGGACCTLIGHSGRDREDLYIQGAG